MRILAIDDNQIHRDAAQAQLKEHDLTVVGTYDEAQRLIMQQNGFEVVLCDLLMPASGQHQGSRGMSFVGQEMPVGIFLALLAATKGAKYVAVLTDSDHHSHPASACFDAFNQIGEYEPTSFTVNGAKVLLCNDRNLMESFYRDDLAKRMDWCERRKDEKRAEELTVRTKDWRRLFDYLIA